MSLINQVLKDLEQRHAGEVRGAARAVRPLPEGAPRRSLWIVLALVVTTAAAGAAWWYLSPSPAPVSSAQAGGVGATLAKTLLAAVPPPAPTTPAVSPSASAAAIPDAPASALSAVAPEPNREERQESSAPVSASLEGWTQGISGLPQNAPTASPRAVVPAPTKSAVLAHTRALEAAAAARSAAEAPAPVPALANPKPADESLPKAKRKASEPTNAAKREPAGGRGSDDAPPDSAEPAPNIDKQVLPPSARERAEADFREGMAALDGGDAVEAEEKLRAALAIDPLTDKARQALLGLYIQQGRREDAELLLEDRVRLDRKQAGFALALGRLQLERGANSEALATLQGSLPYGEGNAAYQAMLANALGRLGRHKEAAERFEAAARLAPRNPVWLMGLGVELRADNRPRDARLAFQRAREVGGLNPQLASFVDQQLRELK